MAMIKCPECGKDVSSKASSCPSCGNPVAMKSGPFGGHEKGITARPGFWHDRNVGAIGFLILFIVLLIIAGRLLVVYGGFGK
jgi:uncharacterized membrane protein YvbJ